MKKIFAILLFSIFGITNYLFAQPTIQKSDVFAPIGSKVILGVDNTFSGQMMDESKGANKNWNFTFLSPNTRDTIEYLNPSSTPYPESFPTADLSVFHTEEQTFTYYDDNGANLSALGFGYTLLDVDIIQKFTTPVMFTNFPLVYNENNTYTTTSESRFLIFPDSIKYVITTTVFDSVNAYGTITLPGGTNFNVLRENSFEYILIQKYKREDKSPDWILTETERDTLEKYNFYTNNIGAPLLTVSVNRKTGAIEKAEYLINATVTTLYNNSPNNSQNLSLNPNPNNGTFTVDGGLFLGNSLELTLFDGLGNSVYSEIKVNLKNEIGVSIDNLKPGVYFLSISDGLDKKSQKLIIY